MGIFERLKEIEGELSSLSKEEQEKRINELLSTLSDEELDELKKQQCIFCSIVQGNASSYDIYEDDFVKAVLDIKPASKGHVLLFPKEHFQLMALMPGKLVSHIFNTANMLSKAVFGGVNAQGTNIYLANGAAAGQIIQHFSVHIIPRFNDDKLVIPWKGKEINEEIMNSAAKAIRSKIPKKETVEEKEVKVESIRIETKRRLP